MRVLACLFLVACGGGSGEVEGDPLIQSTLQGEFNNKPWTPMYGFGRTETNNFSMFIGAQKISCADDFEGRPREGNYAATGVPKPVAIGTFSSVLFQVIEVVDGELESRSAPGSVMITAVSDTEVSAVYGFSVTLDGGRYGLTGAVTLLRCPE